MSTENSRNVVGIVTYANGEIFSYTDPQEYLRVVKEELPYYPITGFRCKTLTNDPQIRNAVNAMVYDLYGEKAPSAPTPENPSNMDGVKQVAKMLLYVDIAKTRLSPMVVQHPFTNSGLTGHQTESGIRMLNLTENEEDLALWRDGISERIAKAEKPMEIFLLLNTPYKLTFLKYAEPHLSKSDFSELLGNAWIMSEYANSDAEVSKAQLVGMFKRTDPTALMNEDELEQFGALDDPVTVYRGVTSYNAKNIRALSWTLSYETAAWFAHRFDEDGKVYSAQVDKEHIFALFSGRGEDEVVLDPKSLKNIALAEEPTHGMGMTM